MAGVMKAIKNRPVSDEQVQHLAARAEGVARFSQARHEGARYLMLRYRPQLEGAVGFHRSLKLLITRMARRFSLACYLTPIIALFLRARRVKSLPPHSS